MSNNISTFNGITLNATSTVRPIAKLCLNGTVATDYIIPENVSDTQAILKNDCRIKVSEMLASNNSVSVRGTAYYTLLLLGEDGSLSSVRASEDFELKEFVEGADENAILIYENGSPSCNCRLVNPRKLNLSADIALCVSVRTPESVVPTVKGAETIEDEISLKRKQGAVTYTDTLSLCENDIPVSHDIALDGNLPPISSIVYHNVKVRPYEISAIGNTLKIKSKAVFSCIYRSEEGNIFALENSITLEKDVDFDEADGYEWFGIGSANDISAEPAIDSYGESKLIELDFNYDIILNGVRNVTVETVTDAYSTEFECETVSVESESEIFKRTYATALSVNAFVDRENASAENVRNVLIGSVRVSDIACEYSDEKRRLVIEAKANISGVCENNITSETDPKFAPISFDYPFRCELDVGEYIEGTEYSVSLNVTDKRFRCDQNKIYCDFENDIRCTVSEKASNSYLNEIILDKKTPIATYNAPMTLCYPSGEETLWDIAKYYKVTMQGIVTSNNLDSDEIRNRRVLLIPSYKKSVNA